MTFLFGFVCGVAFVPTALLGLAAACDAWSTWTTTDITIAKLLWFLGPRHRWRSARMVHALHAGHALGNASLWAVDGPGVLGWVVYHRAAARRAERKACSSRRATAMAARCLRSGITTSTGLQDSTLTARSRFLLHRALQASRGSLD